MSQKTALVTGAAGFVGFSLSRRLLKDGWRVVGVDSLSDYYDVRLKDERLKVLRAEGGEAFTFVHLDIVEKDQLLELFLAEKPESVVHLAAQASVRYGLKNQEIYIQSNLVGHGNILAACKALNEAGHAMSHLLYASSSSVYGGNEKVPFSETDDVSLPQSLYAATKRADELVTEAWCHQFKGSKGGFAASGLRFFTVYGPWGRPDMSPVLFASNLMNGTPIPLYNGGDLWRDFTYIDDIVEAIVRLMPVVPVRGHEVYNLGNQNPVKMEAFVEVLADALGVSPVVDKLPWPPTEVYKTYADTSKLKAAVGWAPQTDLQDGLARFAEWYAPRHGSFNVGGG